MSRWCPECLERSRHGVIQPASACLTEDGETLRRGRLADQHALALLREGLRPVLYQDGVGARHAVMHFTSVSVLGDTPQDSRQREPGEDAVGVSATQTQMWVPRWVWLVDYLFRGARSDKVRGARDAWLLELEDDPEARDAALSAYDLGGEAGAAELLRVPAPPPPRSKGGRWLRLVPTPV